jgi:hypothetical protein
VGVVVLLSPLPLVDPFGSDWLWLGRDVSLPDGSTNSLVDGVSDPSFDDGLLVEGGSEKPSLGVPAEWLSLMDIEVNVPEGSPESVFELDPASELDCGLELDPESESDPEVELDGDCELEPEADSDVDGLLLLVEFDW